MAPFSKLHPAPAGLSGVGGRSAGPEMLTSVNGGPGQLGPHPPGVHEAQAYLTTQVHDASLATCTRQFVYTTFLRARRGCPQGSLRVLRKRICFELHAMTQFQTTLTRLYPKVSGTMRSLFFLERIFIDRNSPKDTAS